MVINIMDRDFNFLGQIDEYVSFSPTKRYSGVGRFELHLHSDQIYANELIKENIIFTEEGKAFIIMYRKRMTSSGTLEIRGIELKGFLSRMIIFPPDGLANYRLDNNIETVMKEYVQATLTRKNISNIEVAPNQNRGNSFIYQTRYKNLAEELEKISLASGLGWDITLDLDRKKFVFDIIEGRDVTIDQTDLPPAIFSVDYDNVQEQTLEESNLDYVNTAIVAGQGEGAERAIQVVGDTNSLDSIETFVDARDIADAADLADRGQQKLKEREEILVFDSRVLTDKNLVYEEDFKLGDVSTIQNNEWEMTVNRRITEITEIYEEDGFRLEVSFGNNIPSVIDKIRRMTDFPIAENNVSVGDTGPSGDIGPPGPKGDIGPRGIEGPQGIQGPKGLKGDTGKQGIEGPQGPRGYKGDKGNDGNTPTKGIDYFDGAKGDRGEKGERGIRGIQGIQGNTGLTGKAIEHIWNGTSLGIRQEGASAYNYVDLIGPQGIQGIRGLAGAKGDTGDRGLQGIQGIQGVKGEKGDPFTYSDFTGPQLASLKGTKGDKGDTGNTGPKGDIGPRGIQGEVGPRGLVGPKGDKGSPFIYSDFTASQIANLKGAKGDKGDIGPRGLQGIQGIQGPKGAAVADSVEWNKVLNKPGLVNRSGDTMTGPLTISGSVLSSEFKSDNWSFINHYTGGGWARGIVNIKDKDEKNYMQIGVHGGGQSFSRMYFGRAYNDWAMEIFPSNNKVNFGGVVTKNNKELATVDDIPKTVTSSSEPVNLKTGDRWHREY